MNIRLHTYEEAATVLRVKVSWLQQRIKQLPHTKLGGTVYFTDDHLLRIVAQFSHEPEQSAGDSSPTATPATGLAPVPLPLRSRARA